MCGMSETSKQAIRRAVTAAHGVKNLAKACGVSVQAVYKWMENGVTAERAKQIEQAVDGAVGRHEMRPDLYHAPAAERVA